jgi:hypothetical protein
VGGSVFATVSELSDPYPGITKVLQFIGPSGHVFELAENSNRLERLFYGTPGVRPRRLGHALLKVEDLGALVEYFADILRVESEESYQWKDSSDIPEWNNFWGPMPPANFPDYGIPLVDRS